MADSDAASHRSAITYGENVLHRLDAVPGTGRLKARVDLGFDDGLLRAAWKQLLERHRAGAIDLTNEDVEAMNEGDPPGGADDPA